ncbi:hypothetical protein DENSPDRAFT_185184 [Dentipellis sp. KUC8613]|nr:hypothetical protein DENSPDRAFT_185184 [Dentipellis sp. KUC8613]
MSSDSSPGTPFPMDSPDPVVPSPSTPTTSTSFESSPSQSSSSVADYRTNTGDSSSTLTFLLVFLAIFVVFMGTVVGGRRALGRRRAAAEEARLVEERRTREDQRPMMWDVWLERGDKGGKGPCEGSSASHDNRWADIMPMSAWVDSPRRRPPTRSPPPGLFLPSPAPIPYALDHHVMMSQAWFRGIYPLEAPVSSSDAHPPTPTPSPVPEPPKLHVSVLIQMPSPNRTKSQSNAEVDAEGTADNPGRNNVLGEDGEYMIGLADMPASILGPETNWLRGLARENI